MPTKKTKVETTNGKIITFYSYKGGVGRSMALANMACLLAKKAKKVLMIDWDIEAPGLHEYFRNYFDFHILRDPIIVPLDNLSTEQEEAITSLLDKGALEIPGLKRELGDKAPKGKEQMLLHSLPNNLDINLITDFETFINKKDGLLEYFLETDRNLSKIDEEEATEKQLANLQNVISNIQNYITEFYITEHDININISILKAGRLDEGYSDRIDEMNWAKFYEKVPSFFTRLAFYLKTQYDYILIDSRTGHTDTGGICTMIMPEKLVLVYTPNEQSLNGVLKLAEKAANYRKNSDDLRPLSIYPLPSRVELAEDALRKKWKEGYNAKFTSLYKKIYNLPENISLDDYFDSVQLRHVPKYAYGEDIAVLIENEKIDTITQGYENLLEYFDKAIWGERKEVEVKEIKKIAQNKPIKKYKILISTIYEKHAIDTAKSLGKEIENKFSNRVEVKIVYDNDSEEFEEEYFDLIADYQYIILLVTQEKGNSIFYREFEAESIATLISAGKKIIYIGKEWHINYPTHLSINYMDYEIIDLSLITDFLEVEFFQERKMALKHRLDEKLNPPLPF
jgi:hypothetical protein